MATVNPHNQDLKLALTALFLLHEDSRFRRLLHASDGNRRHAAAVYAVVTAVTGARRTVRFLR